MKSGYIIFALVVISITLTSVVTTMLVSEFGIESEKNIFVRFLLKKLGMLTFPVLNISAVLFIYFISARLRKLDVRVASSFLLSIMFISIFDLAHDIQVLVAHNSPFTLFTFFLLVPVIAILSSYLFITNKVSPLKF